MLVRESRTQPPPLESYSDTPLFNTKAVVHQTGVPAPTLRAWERRYGILAPRRGDNDYRLYSERDMAIITWLRERVETGLTISQAIALLRALEPSRRRARRARASGPLAPEAAEARDVDELRERSEPASAADPSRSRLALSDISAALLRQFATLDESSANQTIAQAFAIYSIEDVCLSLFAPTLARLGQLWREGAVTVTTEHFASSLIRERLASLFRSAPMVDDAPLALVGCAPGELHELGPLMLALFLRRAGLRVVYLGQSIELESLVATIEAAGPASAPVSVLLSAALRPQAETLIEVGRRLAALKSRYPLFFFGGQAFTREPDLVKRVQGAYLDMEAPAAAQEIKRRLTA